MFSYFFYDCLINETQNSGKEENSKNSQNTNKVLKMDSDVDGLKIKTSWYLDENNTYPLEPSPLLQNGYYYVTVNITSKDGECELATNADVYTIIAQKMLVHILLQS